MSVHDYAMFIPSRERRGHSDFSLTVLHCRTLEVWDEIKAANENKPNPEEVAILTKELPVYEVSVGRRAATLQKVEVHDGRTIAYFAINCTNPITGKQERYAWRYRVADGRPVQDKAFPVTIRGRA